MLQYNYCGNAARKINATMKCGALVLEIDSALCRVATNFPAELQRIPQLNLISSRVFYIPLQIEFTVLLSDPERESNLLRTWRHQDLLSLFLSARN
jgi:hypothetical protein